MKKTLILILLSLTMMKLSLAQFPESSNPVFSGVFRFAKARIPDSLMIVTYPNIIPRDKATSIVKVDEDGRFSFKLKNKKNQPLYIKLLAFKSGKQIVLGNYFTENEDNIIAEVSESPNTYSVPNSTYINISFKGKGSEKYTLTDSIESQFQTFRKELNNLKFDEKKDSATLSSALQAMNILVAGFIAKKRDLIARSNINNPDIKTLLENEFGLYYGTWLMLNEAYLNDVKHDEELKALVRRNFKSNQGYFFVKPSEISIVSPLYIQNLVLGLKTEIKIHDLNGEVQIEEYYNSVKNRFTGIVKERMIIEFFTTPQSRIGLATFPQSTYDSLLKDASNYIEMPFYAKLISDKVKFKQGTNFIGSTFLDLDGKAFNTESLRGKTILIDVWGEGCTACSVFHKKFEKDIYPFFQNNKNFVVLSISVDKKREKWLSGIKSGKMSSEYYQNVSTGILGIDHPFLKNYNVYSIPFLLLIDPEHKIFANLTGSGLTAPTDELVKLIKEAMRPK